MQESERSRSLNILKNQKNLDTQQENIHNKGGKIGNLAKIHIEAIKTSKIIIIVIVIGKLRIIMEVCTITIIIGKQAIKIIKIIAQEMARTSLKIKKNQLKL